MSAGSSRRQRLRTSAAAALAALPSETPVLVTTGDHALLEPEMVRHFLAGALSHGGDLAVALAPHDLVQRTYPRTRRTVLKFSDGRFCGCNLFAFLTPRGREMVKIWQQSRGRPQEAHPGRRSRRLGRDGALRARHAESDGGVRRISRQTGIAAGVVTMPFAEAAIDVDSVADLELVRAIVARGAAKARAAA